MDDSLSRIRKCCDLIYSVLQLDVAVLDRNWEPKVVLLHTPYPTILDPFWTDYYEKMRQSLASAEPFACSWHEVSDCSMIFLDIRLGDADGTELYVIIGPALTQLHADTTDRILRQIDSVPPKARTALNHFFKNQPFFNTRTKSSFWIACRLLNRIDTLEDFSIGIPYVKQTFLEGAPSPQWREDPISEDQVLLNYEAEQKWRTFITLGDAKSAKKAGSQFADNDFTYRNPGNPFRVLRNLLTSTNALARAAAYDGGASATDVHRVHEYFYGRIENVRNALEIEKLYAEMCDEYCAIVLAARTAQFSPPVKLAVHYIHSHYNQKITLQAVAKELNYSEGHLSRIFQKETGRTMGAYLNDLRIENARKLLDSGLYSITEAALMVGFSSYEKFSVEFKKHTGMTASDYMKK